jgi:hypothetical protein
LSSIISEVYPDSKIKIKFGEEKVSPKEFSDVDEAVEIDKLVIIIRII